MFLTVIILLLAFRHHNFV